MTLREKKEIELEQSNFWGRHHGPARMALSLSFCHGDWGVTDGRLTCNGSIFRELYNTGRRKHRQHLINHNLSQIRIHYHQEAGGPFPLFLAASEENETRGIL